MFALILDDARTDLAAATKATDALGYETESTDDPAVFRDVARTRHPDIQIVDYELPNIKDRIGLRDGPELVAVEAAESRPVPTVFLTNYEPDCAERLAELDPRLVSTIVEKPAGVSPDAWSEALRVAIDDVTSHPEADSTEPLGVPVAELESEYFRLQPPELHGLSEDTRDDLEAHVAIELHDRLLPVWDACSEDWLMLQKIDDTVLVTDRGDDDRLPTDDAVRDSEHERGSVALIVGRPTLLEEIGTELVECTPTQHHKDWRRYPFVRLIVSTDERDFHLDTGSAISYISREYLGQHVELPRRSKRTIVSDVSGRQDAQSWTPIDIELHVSGPNGNVLVPMRLRAVKNWHRTMLSPLCEGQRCPGSADGQCGRRLGLMGRDMLYRFEDGLWQFNPRTGQFYPLH